MLGVRIDVVEAQIWNFNAYLMPLLDIKTTTAVVKRDKTSGLDRNDSQICLRLQRCVCPFTKNALNFRPPKICASPHRPAVFFRLLSSSRHHCAVWCSVQYSVLSFCSVTAQAHRKSRVRSNNAPTRNVYVTLVYVFLIAVALLCFDMLWYSWSVQCWSNLLHWSAPRYALLAFADNTALPGFLYFYICFITPNHIFYSFPDDLRDLMSINSYYAIISLWMYGRDARFPLTRTHTH